jgi:hypothetical protein
MVQEELCRLALQAAEDAYSPDNKDDYASLEPPEGYTAEWIWDDPTTGFKAVLYTIVDELGVKHGIVAFAGTEDGQDMLSDLNLGWDQWDANRNSFFSELENNELSSITFAGHSLGGALAQYATYEYVATYTEQSGILPQLVTFNGLGGIAGLEANVPDFDKDDQISINSAHFVVDGDLVSQLGDGHLGGDVYLLQRVAEGDFFDPVNDHATYLTGTPFNLLSGHTISNVQALVDIDGFQDFKVHEPDYLQLSAILQQATELTFSILEASHQTDNTVAINMLCAGLVSTLAEISRLPAGSVERTQLADLIAAAATNICAGTSLFDYQSKATYAILGNLDLVAIASLPQINEQLDTAVFFLTVETLLADAMHQPDNRLGIEGAEAFATLLIDYAETAGVDLDPIRESLHERLVTRFTEGDLFDVVSVIGKDRFITGVVDWAVDQIDLGSSGPEETDATFRIGSHALIVSDDTSPRVINGSNGNDVLLGKGERSEVHQGFAGDDLLYGAEGRDYLKGGSGDDWLLGGSGDDFLEGGEGNDRLEDGDGADRLVDRSGDDAYMLRDDGAMDTVIDADGVGRLYLDGVELSGGASVGGSSSHFSDGTS